MCGDLSDALDVYGSATGKMSSITVAPCSRTGRSCWRLYNSLFRFDQDLLVNGHAYGAPAGHSPVMHLRHVPGGRMWEHFMRSFEEVWTAGTPIEA